MKQDDYRWYLKMPEWKEKRDEILKRDTICQRCGSDKLLDVHHLRYIKNKLPWDYPNDYLTTLCRKCHTQEHRDKNEFYEMIQNLELVPLWHRELINKLKNG